MPLGPECGLRAHAVLDASGLPLAPAPSAGTTSSSASRAAPRPARSSRLSDHVLEPDDHEHD
jgi:hypothetical protein